MLRVMCLILFSVTLAACATEPEVKVEEKIVTRTVTVKPEVRIQARPRPVNLRDVEFYVVTEENFDEFAERFKSRNGELVFIAISVDDYEDLSFNLADLKRYINQQKEIIVFYENAVE